MVLLFAAARTFVGGGGLAPPPLPELGEKPPETRPAAAAFALPSLSGERRALGELRGRVVLVHFWATWCPPCVEELPALDALHEALSEEGLAVLAVSVDAGAPEPVRRFAEGQGLGLPVLHDPARRVADRYGVYAYPTTVIVDRAGRVVHRAPSAWNWEHPDARAWMRDLLAEPAAEGAARGPAWEESAAASETEGPYAVLPEARAESAARPPLPQ